MAWKNTCAPLLGSVLRQRQTLFSQSRLISESLYSYWLLFAALLSDKGRCYELIGCWKKWRASRSKTGLWRLDKLSYRRHRQLESSWDKPVYTSLHRCNFPCNRLVSQTGRKRERETTNEIQHEWSENREGRGQPSWFLRSLMLELAWFPNLSICLSV